MTNHTLEKPNDWWWLHLPLVIPLKFGQDFYHPFKCRPTFLHWERERVPEVSHEPRKSSRGASNGPCVPGASPWRVDKRRPTTVVFHSDQGRASTFTTRDMDSKLRYSLGKVLGTQNRPTLRLAFFHCILCLNPIKGTHNVFMIVLRCSHLVHNHNKVQITKF